MKAQFKSTCRACGGVVMPGTDIARNEAGGWKHAKCPQSEGEESDQSPVAVPAAVTRVEHLLGYSSFGGSWKECTPEQTSKFIAMASAHLKITAEGVAEKLLRGETVEYEHTDWESTPCYIRDGAVVEAMLANATRRQEAAARKQAKKYGHYRCSGCGASGPGGEYPFSTAPGSGFCDDCL